MHTAAANFPATTSYMEYEYNEREGRNWNRNHAYASPRRRRRRQQSAGKSETPSSPASEMSVHFLGQPSKQEKNESNVGL